MIRSTIKRGIKKILGMDAEPAPVPSPPPAPAWKTETVKPPEPVKAAEPEKAPEPAKTEPVKAEPVQAADPASEAAPVAEKPVVLPTDDTAGKMLSMEAVQEIMDEMVRPALQGDGGDISLIKVENNDIYVKLVGSCSTCPSSIMTMKMGVEALLKEEFPMMGSLIQVE